MRLGPNAAALHMFELSLPYLFAPGADIVDIDINWDGVRHPELRGFGITAVLRAPSASRTVTILANCHVRLTAAGWTDGLLDFLGEQGHERLERRLVDLSQPNPEPRPVP